MSGKTTIEWTDASWNPIRGCSRVSEGCRNCYAEKIAARFSGAGQPYEDLAEIVNVKRANGQTATTEARWTGILEFIPERLEDPLHWKHPRRVFVNSMSDLFHPGVSDGWIKLIFQVMAKCPQHTFQILTKRPERMKKWVLAHKDWLTHGMRKNWWLGVSVEDQATADARIPLLLQTPSSIRWISYEPALGPVNLGELPSASGIGRHLDALSNAGVDPGALIPNKLDWVVCGGESGGHARPMHLAWARSMRDQCVDAGTPFFFKQWGEYAPGAEEIRRYSREGALVSDPDHGDAVMMRVGKKIAGRELDGRVWDEYPTLGAAQGHG